MFISIMSLSTMSKEWERVHGLGGKNEIEIEDLNKFFDFGISYPLAIYSFLGLHWNCPIWGGTNVCTLTFM